MKAFKPTYHINNSSCKISLSITALISKLKTELSMIDGGTDTHLFGNIQKQWHSIDYITPRVDIIGLDSNIEHKKQLPIFLILPKPQQIRERKSS